MAILDPNRAFEAKYSNFTIETTDGRILSGLIAAETGNSVTLKRQEGKEDVLLRKEIEEMASTGQSLMPEGLEKDLSIQDVANLIAYLSASGPPRKEVEGNHPETAHAGSNGAIVLKAETAEIYGDTLTLEPRYRNLGIWSAETDRAAWTFEVDKPGKYTVWIEWACAEGSEGNPYLMDFGSSKLEGKVASTGDWDTYRTAQVGEVNLVAGRQRVEMRATARIRGALIDLRAIELRPVEANAGGCCGEP